MFETATFTYGPPSKRVWTTAMGFTGQAVLIGCAVLAPLISPQTLGRVFLVTTLVTPGAPPPPPPPGPKVVPLRSRAAATRAFPNALIMPASVPQVTRIIVDPPEAASGGAGVPGGVPGGERDGVPGGILPGIIEAGARMTPVAHLPEAVERPLVNVAPAPAKPPRITVLRMATPIHKVEPVYPVLARQARVSGTVELLGVLGIDGRIHELKVLRGHPLLINAALDAVRQWIYEPTLLNGVAVEVAAPITVNFILN
jgi:periplasmic protein TonB